MIKLSKQSKLYAGVLGLALGALAVDRVFLGGGALTPQSAMAVALEAEMPAVVSEASVQSQPSPVPQRSLARSLDSLRWQTLSLSLLVEGEPAESIMCRRVSDWKRRPIRQTPPTARLDAGLFGGGVDWLAGPTAVEPTPPPQPDAPKETLDDVLARHRITAVVEAKVRIDESFVVVDGNRVRLGHTFDGVTVVSIHKGQATFARGSERREIDLRKHQLTNNGERRATP